MARRRKKQAQVTLSATDEKRPKRITTAFGVSVIITLILGGIPFGLGKYIEFNSPDPFDSGAFVYSAKRLINGARLWVDEMPSARTGTLIANIIGVKFFGFNDTGPIIIQMVLQLGALGFMFYVLRKLFGSVAGVVGTTVAAIYLSAPLIAKFGNAKEQFMIPFMIAAACSFLLYEYSRKHFWLILSGFFAVQPYYFKPTGLSIVIALLVCIVTGNVLSGKWKRLILDLALFSAGYIAGLLVPESLYIWQRVPQQVMHTLPFIILQTGIMLGVVIFGIAAIIMVIRRVNLLKHLRQVSKWIWIAGLCLIAATFLVAVSMIKKVPGSENSDIASYFYHLPMFSIPRYLFYETTLQVNKLLAASGLRGGYVSNSWKAITVTKLAPKVFRYYKALSVPILLAIGSIIAAAVTWTPNLIKKTSPDDIQSKLVWVLAIWWILDMAFVWGSPRSYEQYYLPLCASAAMLSGYVVWKWQKQLMLSRNKTFWLLCGLAAMITLGSLSIPIFIGQRYSPDQGKKLDYLERYGHRRRGFGPALKELPSRKQGAWVAAGDYILTHSAEDDTIYVWGWVPGIYVQAQRLAPTKRAFYGDMHVVSPLLLSRLVSGTVSQMKENPPKFIVDSRKQHFPNDRPPLELWPIVPPKILGNEKQRSLKNNPQEIAVFDARWEKILETQIEPDEAERYKAMKPFRDFVMNNYRIVRQYGNHILLEHLETPRQ